MKQCQSCGMPLHTAKAGDCRGTEADGSLSETWCSLCFREGAFIDPECTVDQMKQIVDAALQENGNNRVFRWLALKQIPKLQRWTSPGDGPVIR